MSLSDSSPTPFELKEIAAQSIITASKLPDCDFVVNPYTGCRFGCTYCYASFMGKFVNKTVADWGEYVYVKTNAVELMRTELKKFKNKGKGVSIFFSSVTDPYQGLEAKYQLTRGCLEALAEFGFLGTVGILTKSNLVLRDIAVFKKLTDVEVGLTITSTDDAISRYFEKYAPSVSVRLEALRELNKAGISTYAFVGPLLPHFVAQPEKLSELFAAIAETGIKELYIEHINLKNYILERLKSESSDLDPTILATFYSSQSKSYRDELNKLLEKEIEKHGFVVRLGSAMYHADLQKKN